MLERAGAGRAAPRAAAAPGGGGGGEPRGVGGLETTVAGADWIVFPADAKVAPAGWTVGGPSACRVGEAEMVGVDGTLSPGAVASSACRRVGVAPGRLSATRSSAMSRPV